MNWTGGLAPLATTLSAMRAVDVYLTRKATTTWPGAVVYKEEDLSFTLERPAQERLTLGANFGLARQALVHLRKAAELERDP